MKKICLRPWQLYAVCFVGCLGAISVLNRLFPGNDPEGPNLLVNATCALSATVGFIIGDRYRRKHRRTKEEVMKRLKR